MPLTILWGFSVLWLLHAHQRASTWIKDTVMTSKEEFLKVYIKGGAGGGVYTCVSSLNAASAAATASWHLSGWQCRARCRYALRTAALLGNASGQGSMPRTLRRVLASSQILQNLRRAFTWWIAYACIVYCEHSRAETVSPVSPVQSLGIYGHSISNNNNCSIAFHMIN